MRHFDVGLVTLGIDRFHWRGKKENDGFLFKQPSIPVDIPWVGGKIFLGRELGGIDKDRDNQSIASFPAVAHETQMPLMKKTHGGNENHTPPLAVLRLTPLFHLRNGLNHPHRIWHLGALEYWSMGMASVVSEARHFITRSFHAPLLAK